LEIVISGRSLLIVCSSFRGEFRQPRGPWPLGLRGSAGFFSRNSETNFFLLGEVGLGERAGLLEIFRLRARAGIHRDDGIPVVIWRGKSQTRREE
jgi:hypothetical protein